jgi:putative transposase
LRDNTDQGSPFTAEAFTGKLGTAGIEISIDGRGRFMDNIFIERLWRSIKYEEAHRKAYADGCEARRGISSWMNFYNFRRPRQAMNNQMPIAVWRAGIDKIQAAATAVDMPLRLDNANPSPTYPRHKPQQAARFLKDKGSRDYILNPTTHGPTNGVQFTRRSRAHPEPASQDCQPR